MEQNTLIHNAGLVIAWPFFSRLFEETNLVKNNAFIDEQAQHKAVRLLHYLVHNQLPKQDTGLQLNKILCGLPPEAPVGLTGTVGENWEELRSKLWQAIKQGWDKLKNTSTEALIESFIIREAMLTQNENGYHVRVENKGYDVLLITLPWSIHLIKLPWMTTPIQVLWR